MWFFSRGNYTDYPNWGLLLFRVLQQITSSSGVHFFTNESSIGCLDIIEYKYLCLVKYYILIK